MANELARTLSRARATWRLADAVRALAAWAAPSVAALLALFLLDNLLHLPGWLRLTGAALWLLAVLPAFLLRAYPVLVRRRGVEATARMLEERLGVESNVFINAVQLGRDARAGSLPVPEAALHELDRCAAESAQRVDVGRLWRLRPLLRALKFAAVAGAAATLYGLVFPAYAANAFQRFRDPLGDTPPLTSVFLEVEPGDASAVAGDRLEVTVSVGVRRGELPASARLRFRSAGEPWQVRSMAVRAEGDRRRLFAESLGPLTTDLEYRVEAGDAGTRRFHVSVLQPPRVVSVRLRLEPPAYTRAPPAETEQPVAVRALRGTRATLRIEVDSAPVVATLALPGGQTLTRRAQPATFAFAFDVEQPGTLRLDLAGGARRTGAWSAPLTVVEDTAPRVTLAAASPTLLLPPGTELALTATGEDDFGLSDLRFRVRRLSNDAEAELKAYTYDAPGQRRAVERLTFPLDPATFVPGERYRFVAQARDFRPGGGHVVTSQPVVVRIARAKELVVDAAHPLASPFELLRRLAERQREVVAKSVSLVELFDEHVAKGRFRPRARGMAKEQAGIRAEASRVAAKFRAARGGETYAAALDRLEREEFRLVAEALSPLPSARTDGAGKLAIELALPRQRRALAALEALLGRIALAAAQPRAADEPPAGEKPVKPWEKELQARAEKLAEFLEEQRKLIELTRELERKNPEDWTEADDELKGRLEAQELKWARFFEEAFTDLSKVADQDFSNSGLADEFNEVYMEVKKAADALSENKVEIAVPVEQAGLELAEKLESNLERWLTDTPDFQKWVMEEPAGDYDVPLADLPEELEDIVGDLIDDADAMDESVEDVSSGWMDSLDKGAGWDASGGPISNMSAKGITGNRLPNTDEISGRSGEGRSGKSHGQFVEKTAEGKGGRETPTRLTEDPYESGSVEDRSNEATGGATGGGKLAGQGMEGLRGRVPPGVLGDLDRLAGRQGELRQRAERLARTLRKLHLPAGDLEEAAKQLGWSENHLRNAVGFDLRAAHSAVKAALLRSRASLDYEARTLRERGVNLPKRVRDELMNALDRAVPTGYEDILQAYYRAIAEGK